VEQPSAKASRKGNSDLRKAKLLNFVWIIAVIERPG